jgi:hypothetical protein
MIFHTNPNVYTSSTGIPNTALAVQRPVKVGFPDFSSIPNDDVWHFLLLGRSGEWWWWRKRRRRRRRKRRKRESKLGIETRLRGFSRQREIQDFAAVWPRRMSHR